MWVQRIATSGRYSDGLMAVRYEWSFADQLEAHVMLDALDEIRALQRPDPPKKRR